MYDERRLNGELKAARRIGYENGQKEGRKDGHAKGLAEGRAEGRAEIIRQMYQSGMEVSEIRRILNIEQEEIETILTE